MRKWPTVAAALVAALVLAGGADALTRQQANAIALKTLRPQALKGPTILFGLPQALPATAVVVEAGSPKITAVPFIPKGTATGKAAWLFWVDQAAYARFLHPSRLLLVDDGTGRVLRNVAMSLYPLVDGKPPAFLATPKGYEASATRVYSNLPKGTSSTRAPAHTAAPTFTRAVPARALRDDCLISIGLRDDPNFAGDFRGMSGWARSVGLRAFRPNAGPGGTASGGAELRSGVRDLVEDERCKDILIFISGHGYAAANSAAPAVQTGVPAAGAPWIGVNGPTLKAILRDHPSTTFKIKIDSCYSGRFVPELRGEANLLVLETASSSTEVAWSKLPARFRAPDGRVLDTPARVNPGRGEFTNGNLAGLTAFFASATEVATAQDRGGSLLAAALVRAFTLGAGSDAARALGLTQPQLRQNLSNFAINGLIGYRHLGTTSEVCVIFGTRPARARVSWSAAITGPGVIEATTKIGTTGSVGEGAVNWGIDEFGTYVVTLIVTDADALRTQTTLRVTVTEAQSTCP